MQGRQCHLASRSGPGSCPCFSQHHFVHTRWCSRMRLTHSYFYLALCMSLFQPGNYGIRLIGRQMGCQHSNQILHSFPWSRPVSGWGTRGIKSKGTNLCCTNLWGIILAFIINIEDTVKYMKLNPSICPLILELIGHAISCPSWVSMENVLDDGTSQFRAQICEWKP